MISVTAVARAQLTLPPAPEAAGQARRAVREALLAAGAAELRAAAELAVSELVTNAVVHAGTEVALRIVAQAAAVRVEIEDGNVHLPCRAEWSTTAATGRGLQIVDAHVDQWDATRTEHGKVVWFEIGYVEEARPRSECGTEASPETVDVTLLDVPVVTHWTWQEHATTLLREYLLLTLDEDPEALDQHAAASQALSLLREQVPAPSGLGDQAEATDEADPVLTLAEVVVSVPMPCVHLFDVVHDLLTRAVSAALDGALLGTPPEPETITAMCEWVCGEVTGQARGARPAPWRIV